MRTAECGCNWSSGTIIACTALEITRGESGDLFDISEPISPQLRVYVDKVFSGGITYSSQAV